MLTTYRVLIARPDENREDVKTYEATDYAAALTMAERETGSSEALIGIPADAFDVARAEGIAFNHADGLLLTPTVRLWTVDALVDRMKTEILADMKTGTVPRSVQSFSDLHDHVDANEYGGLCDDDCPFRPDSDADVTVINRAQDAISVWLETETAR